MSGARSIITAMGLVFALSAAAPAPAPANPLLSGYGGPGAGNQALIGSTLLNGSGGGGSGPSGQPGEASGSVRGAEQPAGGESSAGVTRRGDRVRGAASRSRRVSGGSSGVARAYPTSSRRASDTATVASATLGLSGDDLLYILLALAGLALTIALTRRLTHATATGGRRH